MSQYLGDISAYALAVSQGYTGTEEEYAELMASYATVGQTAVTAAQTATTKASEAATSATTATNKATEATTAATTATTKAAEAQADADAAALDASQAMSAASTATTKASEATTAAATATSAKTDAVAANTAAQSAKTAAQTAQTGAETAAASVSASAAQIATNAEDISQLKSEFTAKVDKDGIGQITPKNIQGVTVSGGNILDDAERLYCSDLGALGNDGYVRIDSERAKIQNQSGYCSFLIPVKPNTHYTANNSIRFMVTLKDLNTTGTTPVRYGDLVTTDALAYVTSFDTGEAEYVIVSWNYNTYPINTFVISEGNTPTTEQTIILPDWLSGEDYSDEIDALETRVDALENVKPKYSSVTGNIANGGNLQLTSCKSDLRKGERIVFEGNITSFDTIRIGLSFSTVVDTDSNQINTFRIDETNISYYARSNSTPVTVPHGLSISGNIQVIWEMTAIATCKITLISDGNLFAHEFNNFTKQTIGNPFVLSDGTVLTDCKLAWTCVDIDKYIWLFGDSYLSYSESRWTYYLHEYGYDQNCLLDGYAGESQTNAVRSLNNLLYFGTPKYGVWCIGMNDGSDSSSAPSENWVTGREAFLAQCASNGITPIFGTIPTVPTINHEQKNAWIRSSGYRYIDFAKAVGASADGSWFSGMLSSDNVHPTAQGARALFARALLDLPEIMVDGF